MIGTDRQGYVPGELIAFSAEVGSVYFQLLATLAEKLFEMLLWGYCWLNIILGG